ncbi:dTMP kinase [Anthocerotibacter panamensis]|uniref:dTMP kinase n=1 Tax=Anthocerotibacter panamensis TaxID=2857077 RepID=UPI001C4025BE|nr:dTMP kinase [Anthocerotibacter panamensis]
MFITFEGGEGAGKSTQIQQVHHWLKEQGFSVVLTREPGGTALGKQVRQFLLARAEEPMAPTAELLLFAADRAQHVAQVLKPALERGDIALCDRYVDSTVAYQGWGRGLDLDELQTINALATGGLMPDLTLWLDVDPALGRERAGRLRALDRMEQDSLAFHERVRAGFEHLWRTEPQRVVRIDANQTIPAVFEDLCAQLVLRLPPHDILEQG